MPSSSDVMAVLAQAGQWVAVHWVLSALVLASLGLLLRL